GIAVVRCQDHALRVLHLTAARPADDGQASAGWLVQRLQQDAPATGERNELERPRTPELGVALPENDELPAGGGEDEGRRGGEGFVRADRRRVGRSEGAPAIPGGPDRCQGRRGSARFELGGL